MKVEFIVNTDINDGRQIFIEELELRFHVFQGI